MSEFTQKWVELLIPVTANYYRKYTGSELSILSGVPQQSASRHLITLSNSGILSSEKQGANKLFYLDRESPSSRALLEILENTKALDFYQKNKESEARIREFLSFSRSVIVFQDEPIGADKKRSSDLNIILVDSDKQKLNSVKKIKELYGLKANIYCWTKEELSSALRDKSADKKVLREKILSNHVLFGDVSAAVKLFSEVIR